MYHSWPTPRPAPFNLARERLLLDECVAWGEARLYYWTSWPSLIVGRLSKPGVDYDCLEARRRGIPVYRRHSGGGPVLHGPGVLAVTMIKPAPGRVPPPRVYEEGVGLILEALALLGVDARRANEGDIVVGSWKIGGSAALITPRGYIYHAIITVDEPLDDIERLTPPRWDLVEAGGVDPVKYRPRPLSAITRVSRRSILQALIEAAYNRGLEAWNLHDMGDPCVEATVEKITAEAAAYAERLACPTGQNNT